MTPEQLKDLSKKNEILQEAFEQWKQHPVTSHVLKNLKKLRDSIGDTLARSGQEMTEVQLKSFCASMKNCDATASMMTNFEKFSEQLYK